MKRLTWFVGGVATGAVGVNYAKRKVRTTAELYTPAKVARSTVERARQRAHDVVDALRDGREAMRAREDELTARRDGRLVSLDQHVGPDDQLLVDGRPVEPGRVIVLRHAK